MKLRVVELPSTQSPLRRSPGFAKKGLSTWALDLMGLCNYGCLYCSSNTGNFLRIRREEFAGETQRQLGEKLYPTTAPDLTFHWTGVVEQLEQILAHKKKTWGAGQTVVFSMLTDGFSPLMVASGLTRRVLDLILARTSFRIRVLTKNACVGLSKEWVEYFAAHADRFVVGLSTGTIDDEWSRRVEINTPAPTQRLKALARLQEAGVPTYGMLCPIFPEVITSRDRGEIVSQDLARLVAAIRPDRCETIWAEPYNDRANWRAVRSGYDEGTPPYLKLTEMFEGRSHVRLWSEYATDLVLALRSMAHHHGWIDRLVYLLYEGGITQIDAGRLETLEGISLQAAPAENGLSPNPWIAQIQTRPAPHPEVL